MGFLVSLLVGAVVGWIAGIIMGSRGGWIRNIILGIVGSSVGHFLAGLIGIAGYGIGDIIISVCGACIVIAVCRRLFT